MTSDSCSLGGTVMRYRTRWSSPLCFDATGSGRNVCVLARGLLAG